MPKGDSKQKKKVANGYKLADPLPNGEIVQDVAKKKWKLGPSIGQGGFGAIYSAQEAGTKGAKYPYVIKIEPHENGPLFVEMHFYIKFAKPDDVENFKKQKGLKTFGMPVYLGSGSHEFNGEKYRFIVMEKFGSDLWQIFLNHNKHFPATTVFKIAIQIVDILEYIHSKGYVHADIKGGNILMGTTKETQNKQVYLVDFGLTSRSNEDPEFKPNPKKAHDGTIEYLSRDAHNGVNTKRGDLESLAYNLIQWLGCVLPWEGKLKDPNAVHKSKEEYMSSVFKFIKECFDKRSPPGPIVDFLNYLSTLSHNTNPDYKNIRKIFQSGLDSGDALGKPLQFTLPVKSPVKRKNPTASKSSPKKKTKKELKKEESEDEKENLEDDSDNEDSYSNINLSRGTGRDKFTTETVPETNGNSNKTEIEIVKRDKKTKKKAITSNEQANVEEEYNISDNETNDKSSKETIETDNSKGKNKTSNKNKPTKRLISHKDEPVAIRTRRRGGAINYKEDSDDEKKPSQKRVKAPKEIHVTGDSLDGYPETTKKSVQQSTEPDGSAGTIKEAPKKGRKKRADKAKEAV